MATRDVHQDLVMIKDYYFAKVFETNLIKIKDFEVRNSDIFLTSFVKAGTTWTQEMVWLLMNNLNYKEAEKLLNVRSPFLENFIYYKTYENEIKPNTSNRYIDEIIGNSLEYAKTLPEPRVLKTHLPWDFLPYQIPSGEKQPKIIYVCRNPKDVCISRYHHYNLLSGETVTLEESCKRFLSGEIMCGPYWRHVLTYWNKRHEKNVMFITYEDMKEDLLGMIKKVATFLGKNYTEEQMKTLSEHLSFEKMKNNIAVNKREFIEFKKSLGVNSKGEDFIRKGIVGSYKTEMPEGYIKKFDDYIKQHFEGSGLHFDY